MDGKGAPIGSELVMIPSLDTVTPTLIYLQAVSPIYRRSSSVEMTIEVYRLGNPEKVLGNLPISVVLESSTESLLRRWFETIIGAGGLVGTLLSVAGAYFIQQQQRQRAKEREEQIAMALSEVDSVLPGLIRRDPSEGARWYSERQERAFPWTERMVQERLQGVWENEADENLQRWMAIWLGEEHVSEEEVVEWAFKNLDGEWKEKIRNWVMEDQARAPNLFKEIEEDSWVSIIKPWPSIRFYLRQPTSDEAFTYTAAEEDLWLAMEGGGGGIFEPAQGENLSGDKYLWIVGAEGSGRTAAAFLTVRKQVLDRIRGKAAPFPFYYPFPPEGYGLPTDEEAVARALADALLHYIAVRTDDFFKQDTIYKAAMCSLFAHFFSLQPRRYSLAGLSPHTSQRLREEIKRLAGRARLSREEILKIMHLAFPRGFQGLLLLVDVKDADKDSMKGLIDLADRLRRRDIGVKVFLPKRLKGSLEGRPCLEWKWEREEDDQRRLDDLQGLLKMLLSRVESHSVADWCKPMPKRDVDKLVVQSAGGTPRGLIEKVGMLWTRYKKKGQLSEEDLIELKILKSSPEDPR